MPEDKRVKNGGVTTDQRLLRQKGTDTEEELRGNLIRPAIPESGQGGPMGRGSKMGELALAWPPAQHQEEEGPSAQLRGGTERMGRKFDTRWSSTKHVLGNRIQPRPGDKSGRKGSQTWHF